MSGLEQWQSDDVRIGTGDKADQRRGAALDRVAASLAAPFSTRQVGRDLVRAQALERDLTLDVAQRHMLVGTSQRNAGMDAVAAPGQQFETAARARFVDRFGLDAPTAGDDRVGGENVGPGMARHYGAQLFFGEAQCVRRRLLVSTGRLVDLGRIDPVGFDPDLPQQFEPARRSRSEHQERRRHRSLIRADGARKSR